MSERVVIVGTGQAAMQVAVSLRDEGFEGEIALYGDEPGLPYQRPPLSKAYMKDGNAERLVLKAPEYYARENIAIHDRAPIASIDRQGRQVISAAGEHIAYTHLVLATGARNRKPPIPGTDLGNVVELRTLKDAEQIRALLPAARHAIVIGGGFIGLEFAAVARAAGVEVTVVEALDRLMARAVSPQISARFRDAHRAAGTTIRFGVMAGAIQPDDAGNAAGVTLADGERLVGDLVLIATGVEPNTGLAADAGLETGDGIVVDSRLLTADPRISAIGDCASVPGPFGERLRLESVQAAVDHARHVARRIVTGSDAAYSAVAWFWSDQGDLRLQIAGLIGGADRTVARPEGGPVDLVLNFRKDRLVAVETVNAAGPHMAARRLLAQEDGVDYNQLEAADFDLRALWKLRSK